jgi:hypothetical protein
MAAHKVLPTGLHCFGCTTQAEQTARRRRGCDELGSQATVGEWVFAARLPRDFRAVLFPSHSLMKCAEGQRLGFQDSRPHLIRAHFLEGDSVLRNHRNNSAYYVLYSVDYLPTLVAHHCQAGTNQVHSHPPHQS